MQSHTYHLVLKHHIVVLTTFYNNLIASIMLLPTCKCWEGYVVTTNQNVDLSIISVETA